MADIAFKKGEYDVKYVDQGDDTYAPAVQIVGANEPIQLTGNVVVDTFGALDDTKVVDPDAASATIPALLRGILEELQAQTAILTAHTALLTDIETNTTPAP
jgi:hypothetical protein